MSKEYVAIISDIHANKYALNAFLGYLEKNYSVSRIINLGDFVQIGPHPRDVAETVLSDSRFVSILGNHEKKILMRKSPTFTEERYLHQDWNIDRLGQSLMDEIGRLPETRIITINNKRLLMVHSRLNDIDSDPLLYQGKTLDEFVSDYDMDVDYILFGHTHCQTYINYWKGKPLVNPGSLGCSLESIMSFCILEVSDSVFSFSFKNIKYDNSQLKKDYVELNVPKIGLIKKFMGIDL